jgi:FHS family Na+ dependent glucose MFS transporter 1
MNNISSWYYDPGDPVSSPPMPPLEPRVRAQTAGYFGGHIVLGLVSASLGPTLPWLAAKLASEPEALGLLFTARGVGYLLGSLACGRLYDRRPAHPLLITAILMLAACMATVPFLPSRAALLGIMLIIGGAQGLLDVGNNTTLVRVHGATVAPFMNALHCFYGVGAMISPVIVAAAGGLDSAYWILAMSLLPAAGWLAMCASPIVSKPPTNPATHDEPDPTATEKVLGAFVVLFLFCQGAESGFGGWIYVIAGDRGFSEGDAAKLLSSFWATFTIGRVLAIGIATRVRPKWMLTIDLFGALVCTTVLLTVPGPTGLWLGTLGLGLSLASVFPAALALAGEYLPLTGTVTSRIFVGASVGTITMPWLIGESFVLGGQAPILAVLLNLACATAVFVLIVTWLRA